MERGEESVVVPGDMFNFQHPLHSISATHETLCCSSRVSGLELPFWGSLLGIKPTFSLRDHGRCAASIATRWDFPSPLACCAVTAVRAMIHCVIASAKATGNPPPLLWCELLIAPLSSPAFVENGLDAIVAQQASSATATAPAVDGTGGAAAAAAAATAAAAAAAAEHARGADAAPRLPSKHKQARCRGDDGRGKRPRKGDAKRERKKKALAQAEETCKYYVDDHGKTTFSPHSP